MKEENKEKLGEVIETLTNLLQAMTMPVPPHIHLQGLRSELPEITKGLVDIYKTESGENPWEYLEGELL